MVEHGDKELAVLLLLHLVDLKYLNDLLETGGDRGPQIDQHIFVQHFVYVLHVGEPEDRLAVHQQRARQVVSPVVLDLVDVVRLVLHEGVVVQLIHQTVFQVVLLAEDQLEIVVAEAHLVDQLPQACD